MTERSAMANALPLAGKVALVTGAAGGIGYASALALAQAGADVALNDLQLTPRLEELAKNIAAQGRRALPLPVDIAEQPRVDEMVAETTRNLGRLDFLISTAVYSDREPFTTANMAGFRKTIDVSMWGSFFALRAAANQMIRQGRGGAVVIVSSPHAQVAFPSCMAYNMAKAAQDQMARTACIELFPHNIRVNILHPGWTDTPGERKYFSEDDLRLAGASLPAGRLARPEEIARGILFLVDPASDYVNGVTLTIDGGLSLPWWSKRGSGSL
jgi:glucose 1-dehydrogenase